MARDLYLVAPAAAESGDFLPRLDAVLHAATAAALMLPQGTRDIAAYAAFAAAVRPLAQSRNCALLLQDQVDLVGKLDADGVHMTGDIKAFREAVERLKPDAIVGAGNLQSRHDAMQKAEAGADYVFFGTPGTGSTAADIALAAWWAETFEIPAVLFEPDAAALEMAPVEFVALGDALWAADRAVLPQVLTASGVAA